MNKDLSQSLQLSSRLEAGLIALAQVWDTDIHDPRINEVRNSAQMNFLSRVNLSMTRLRNGQVYGEVQPFFKELMRQSYTPKLHGLQFTQGTTEHDQAIKFLKDLAFSIGHDVDREYGVVQRLTDPAWIKNGLVPASNVITVNEQDDDIGDWGRDTVPRPLVIDETDLYIDEMNTYGQIVASASPTDLAKYITEKLKPRQEEIQQESAKRRATYPSDTAFKMVEGPLVDFKEYLDAIIIRAEAKLGAPALTYQPQDQRPKRPLPIADTSAITAKLSGIATSLQNAIENSSGEGLKKLYNDTIKPKVLSVQAEVEALKETGQNQDQLPWKEKHLAILQQAASLADTKIRNDNSNQKLETMKAGLAQKIGALNGTALQAFHDTILSPKHAQIKGELETLRQSEPHKTVTIHYKEKHLAVLADGLTSVAAKLEQEAVKKAAPPTEPAKALAVRPLSADGKDNVTDAYPIERDNDARAQLPHGKNTRVVSFKTRGFPSSIFDDSGFEITTKPRGLKGFLQKAWVRATGAVAAVCLAVGFSGPVNELHPPINIAPIPAQAQAEDTDTTIGKAVVAAAAAKDAPAVTVPVPANEPAAKEVKPITADHDVQAPAVTSTMGRTPVAKRAFKPAAEKAAANDQTGSSKPIIVEAFDIATFRPNLQTLVEACKRVGAVKGGVCESIISPEMK